MLSAVKIDSAKPRDKEYTLSDGDGAASVGDAQWK